MCVDVLGLCPTTFTDKSHSGSQKKKRKASAKDTLLTKFAFQVEEGMGNPHKNKPFYKSAPYGLRKEGKPSPWQTPFYKKQTFRVAQWAEALIKKHALNTGVCSCMRIYA